MAHLSRLNITPVKGTALHHPSEAELTPTGLAQNRRFLLIDDRGELFSGYDLGTLVQIRATYDPERETLALAFPDGSEVFGSATELGEATVADNSGRDVAGHVVVGPFGAAFSAYAGRDLRLVRTDLAGEGSDVTHLSVVSTASVARLGQEGGHDGPLDARRFRMDLEIDQTEAFEEDTWAGRRVRIGSAVIRLFARIPRCRVTTQDPDTGIRDWPTLTEIARQRPGAPGGVKIPFGMYAEVETPARVAVGDAVEVLSDVRAGAGARTNNG
jgi:uncharacterized protein YcbX